MYHKIIRNFSNSKPFLQKCQKKKKIQIRQKTGTNFDLTIDLLIEEY